eukprot:CAMPEP_0194526234 /NCGR_PEP_ID=MMETSP0253-20130528/62006_1 /TAXON_ID=2966 /ORGANISM="Noctiluca scintillans" /LENGTH=196 /DNA_ID=CAMNT_0039371051 /DNA_START=39 /DNA_END=629 /DNA_ORIENTATION=+
MTFAFLQFLAGCSADSKCCCVGDDEEIDCAPHDTQNLEVRSGLLESHHVVEDEEDTENTEANEGKTEPEPTLFLITEKEDSNEFEVFIQKEHPKQRLGVSLRCSKDGTRGARVMDLRFDTLIGGWNLQQPNRAVSVGDKLMEINGVPVCFAKDMHAQLSEAKDIHLLFIRNGALQEDSTGSPDFPPESVTESHASR